MIPTVEECSADSLEYLDDPNGSRFNANTQAWGFKKAYLVLSDCFLLYQIPKIKKVVTYDLPANTSSVSPATAGISDFGELIILEERLSGSSERYSQVEECDKLPQRDSSTLLGQFEWRDDSFYFVSATTIRQLQITFYGSGAAPASGTVGIDGSLQVLGKLAAAFMAPRKGEPELGRDLMTQAVGARFEDGIVGGDMRRLILPMVRSQQRVPLAPRPFRAGVRNVVSLGGKFYVAPVTNIDIIPEMTFIISGSITGTDGTDGNNIFTLDQIPTILNLYNNGFLMYAGVDYTLSGNTITFLAGHYPVVGDLLLATGSTTAGVTYVTASPVTPVTFTLSGAINGTNGSDGNAVFGLNHTPTSLQIFKNGLKQKEGSSYTLSGATSVTFLAPNIPLSGDVLEAVGTIA